jgi:hypothetical protein
MPLRKAMRAAARRVVAKEMIIDYHYQIVKRRGNPGRLRKVNGP